MKNTPHLVRVVRRHDHASSPTHLNPQHRFGTAKQASLYNRLLINKAGYLPLDPALIKAILWTESGGPKSKYWGSNPMQIGNLGDPGLAAFLNPLGDGRLVVPPELGRSYSPLMVRTDPTINIKAGTGFLLMRFADYGSVTTVLSTTVHDYTVRKGDTLSSIAKREGSTLDVLAKLNANALKLSIGRAMHIEPAKRERAIISWRPWSSSMVAQRYNGGGDNLYAAKLEYCLGLIRNQAKPNGARR